MESDFEKYRMEHLVRMAEVWKRLVENGATEETKLDFDFNFSADNKSAVEAIQAALSDYVLEIKSEGILRRRFSISGQSGLITWSEEQLLKWVDYMIQIGNETGCEFEGCGASAP